MPGNHSRFVFLARQAVKRSRALATAATRDPVIPGSLGVQTCVLAILDQQRALLEALSDDQYTFVSPLLQATIGGHTRHSLDHLRKPLESLGEARPAVPARVAIRYDLRARQTDVETNRVAALQQIEGIRHQVQALAAPMLDEEVEACFMLSADGKEFAFRSTLSRELGFAVHHCIHHNALVKVLLREHFPKIKVPETYGMAPSTLNHLANTTT